MKRLRAFAAVIVLAPFSEALLAQVAGRVRGTAVDQPGASTPDETVNIEVG